MATRLETTHNKLEATRKEVFAEKESLDRAHARAERALGIIGKKSRDTEAAGMKVRIELSAEGLRVNELLMDAERKAREAIGILKAYPLYPSLRHIALCHGAEVLRMRADLEPALAQEALACLEEAVALLEQPRIGFVEGDVASAEFFAQYIPAFGDRKSVV